MRNSCGEKFVQFAPNKRMRIFVTGGEGMLGQSVCRQFRLRHDLIAPSHTELDICDDCAVRQQVTQARPDWVLHLAALTDVDLCQQKPDLANQVNSVAVAKLAAVCQALQTSLLLMSSIAVFDGHKSSPYLEDDLPTPINVYGQSKWQAEQIAAALPRHLIVRSGWLFGGGPADKKFVSKILSLAQQRRQLSVVDDKIGSPTFTDDLALGLERLLLSGQRGVVHLVNSGSPVTRFQLAAEIVRLAGLTPDLIPVPSTHFPRLAPRPGMEAAASYYTNGWLPPWRAALQTYLAQLAVWPSAALLQNPSGL